MGEAVGEGAEGARGGGTRVEGPAGKKTAEREASLGGCQLPVRAVRHAGAPRCVCEGRVTARAGLARAGLARARAARRVAFW